MSNTNRKLLFAVAVLFLLSALTYRQSVGRADRFQRGQVFLSNLNPDEVAAIEVSKGDESATLVRQGDQFTVSEKQGYPASNSSVNRFLRDLMEISLEREIGKGESLAEELEIEPTTENTIEVALKDSTDKEMVRVRVGKAIEDGPGSYVRRLDEEDAAIFLTSASVSLSSGATDFLEKQIVDHPGSEVVRVEGVDFVLSKPEGSSDLELEGLDRDAKAKTSEVNRLKSMLSGLRYDEVFIADDPQVQGLELQQVLKIDLEDGSGYVLSHASADEKHFLRIAGFNTLQQVAISIDESEEELKEKADKLTRADEIDEFNSFHGSWIYQISDWTAEKLELCKSDLIETEKS